MVLMVLVKPPMMWFKAAARCSMIFGWQQMAATFITTTAFPGFTTGDFQMLRQFFAKAASKAFFYVCTNRIQAAHLLFDQFTSSKIFSKDFRVAPKFIKELAGKLVNAE